MPDNLVLFIYESWKNLDESVDGLTREEATARHYGGSSMAWTIGRVTTMLGSWLNANFQGLPPHPFLVGTGFATAGRASATTGRGCSPRSTTSAGAPGCIWTRSLPSTGLSHTPGRLSSFEEPDCD